MVVLEVRVALSVVTHTLTLRHTRAHTYTHAHTLIHTHTHTKTRAQRNTVDRLARLNKRANGETL